ncbi:hypothetical protein [Silvanigrella sp.]|jgi:hypothetical protein|uniref:hypothetical protein n=1 Tax=Silvanigrella sp. TaxID=2024976 RepID=UPI0037C7A12F
MKNIYFALGCSIYFSTPTFALDTNSITCKVQFDFNKTTFNEKELKNCLDHSTNNKDIKNIEIIASASKGGSSLYNKKLTDKRSEVLNQYISKEIPNVKIASSSLGMNEEYGRSGIIHLTAVSQKETETPKVGETQKEEKPVEKPIENIAKEIEPVKEEVQSNNNHNKFYSNFSLRVARDYYTYDIHAPYLATGAEDGLQYQQNNLLRYELAAQGNVLTNVTGDHVLNLYTYYAAPGVYLTNSGFLIGIRGLAGAVTNEKGQSGRDLGGEVRAGYEYKAFSLILDAGRTESSIRFGINIGFKI